MVWLLALLLGIPLFNFAAWFFLPRRNYINCGYCATCLLLLNALGSVYLLGQVWEQPHYIDFQWFRLSTALSIAGQLQIDKVSAGIMLLANGIGVMVHLYAIFYLANDRRFHRFFGLLGLFIGAMQLLVLTDNLLVVYVAWELVGLCSYLLIGFWYENPVAVKAAQKAFLLNRIGDIGFLLGVGLLIKTCGTSSWGQIFAQDLSGLHQNPLFLWGLGGVLWGCLAKSAQLPFSAWLPEAMQAPTPVSALLHAATLVVAGVYLALRLAPLLSPNLQILLAFVGAFSALVAAVKASIEPHWKKILAYSTISQLGLLFVAVSTKHSDITFLHLFTHAFFKANLFLTVGVLLKDTISPHFAAYVYLPYLLAIMSLMGLPFTAGFLSKEAILAAYWGSRQYQAPTAVLIFMTNCLTVYYSCRQAYLIQRHWQFTIKTFKVPLGHSYWHSPVEYKVYGGVFAGLALCTLFPMVASQPFAAYQNYWLQVPSLMPYASTALGLSVGSWVIGGTIAYVHFVNQWGTLPTLLHQWLSTNYLNNLYEWLWSKVLYKQSRNLSTLDTNLATSLARLDWHFTHLIDHYVVDKVVETMAVAVVVVSKLLAWIDKHGVDNTTNGTAWLFWIAGNRSRQLQNGKIQYYILSSLIWLLVLCMALALGGKWIGTTS